MMPGRLLAKPSTLVSISRFKASIMFQAVHFSHQAFEVNSVELSFDTAPSAF